EDGEDDESDDTEWDGNVMVLAGHDSMPWPLVPSVVSSPSPLSLPSLVPSPSPSSPSLSSPSVSSPSPSVLHLREVVGAEERAQVEGGAAGAWEEEWGARVPGELRGRRLLSRLKSHLLEGERTWSVPEGGNMGGVGGARALVDLSGKVRQCVPLGRFMQAQEQRRKAKAAAQLW
ncbi:hypothetical protein CLOM_g17399, partial [Closterium sp. NIES-68]